MDFQYASTILQTLYHDINGYEVAGRAKNKLLLNTKNFTYGEVTIESFYKILQQAKPRQHEIFYDLGSGTGKPVFIAYVLFNFSKCIGVELLDDLHQVSQSILKRYEHEIQPLNTITHSREIEFIHANFLDVDISKADIIFTHSTCFDEDVWRKLIDKFKSLKKGTRILTVTRTINIDYLKLIKSEEYLMGWGRATVNFYEKK